MPNEPDERTERSKRRRWLVAALICLGLIAAACRHDGSPEWATGSVTGEGTPAEAGGEHGGGEGSEEGGERVEAAESGGEDAGHEGGSAPAPATYLTTSGITRGVFSGPELKAGDHYADKLNDLEFALAYDSVGGSFLGRVKNEANEGLCDSRIKVIFDGSRANSQSVVIPSLAVRERATFTLTADSESFTMWSVQTETFTCDDTTGARRVRRRRRCRRRR